MYNGLKYALIFASGAGIGVLASWKFFETKYNKIADEEIAAMKEHYKNKEKEAAEPTEDVEQTDISDKEALEAEKETYVEIINDYVGEGGSASMHFSKPEVISPDDFGELENYETETLTLYADGVLTDDWDNIIEDVEAMVGVDSLSRFGEYEDDTVFVRNDIYRTDYEICRDSRNYSDLNLKVDE